MKNTTNKTAPKKAAPKTVAKKKIVIAEEEISESMINEVAQEKKVAVKKRKTTKAKIQNVKPAENSKELALQVAQGMFEKKAEDIRILDMRAVKGASADFFVLSHAESDKQVEAIANSVEDEVGKLSDEWPRHREGFINLEWVLLDYFDVIVHVFQREKREFYAVEELWGDAIDIPFEGI